MPIPDKRHSRRYAVAVGSRERDKHELAGLAILAKWHSSSAPIKIVLSEIMEQAISTNAGLIKEWRPEESKMTLDIGGEDFPINLSSALFSVFSQESLQEKGNAGLIPESVQIGLADGRTLDVAGPLEITGL